MFVPLTFAMPYLFSLPSQSADCFLIYEAAHVQKEVGLSEMTPEISITANYIFAHADLLFWANQVICPCTTIKMPANVFSFAMIITAEFHLKIHTCQQNEPKSTNTQG